MPELESDSEGFDPHARRLCPDGSCIGVIGADGRCKVCGLAGGADAAGPRGGSAPEPLEDDDEPDASDRVEAAGGAGFDPNRKLCVDGSCIGVIGGDGRCTECGRTAET
jgi:hypothetical protein